MNASIFSGASTISTTILRELQQLRGVNAAVGAEAHKTLHHSCAGQPAPTRFENDSFVQRLPVPAVGFADEDAKQLSLSW